MATALSALARAAVANSTSTLGQIVGAAHAEAHAPAGAATPPVSDASVDAPGGGHLVTPSPPSAELSASDRMAAAVRSAAARAAPVQSGLAPMMADIEATVIRPDTPETVRQAAKALLESAIPTQRPVTSALVRDAVQDSGVFMEARLARAALVAQSSVPAATGDMKAALLVFRAVISTWLAKTPGGEPGASRVPSSSGEPTAAPRSGAAVSATYAPSGSVSPAPGPAAPPIAQPYRAPVGSNGAPAQPPVSEPLPTAILAPRAQPVISSASAPPDPLTTIEKGEATPALDRNAPEPAPPSTPPRGAPTAPPRPFLMVGLIEDEVVDPPLLAANNPEEAAARHSGLAVSPRPPSRPPPPYAGGPTAAQAAIRSHLPGDLPPAELARRLLKSVDGAIARQELSQIASLPQSHAEAERTAEIRTSRWVFDLPFQTAQGFAVAQFEISRDGGGGGSDSGREIEKTWRARFSLDVEPLGPVHVQIALTGACARVGLWAERPEAVARLQAGEADLSAALREAELSPEVAFHAGAPTVAVTAPGRFVDRAS